MLFRSIPTTYVRACAFEPVFLRVLFVHLIRVHGFDVPGPWIGGVYHRYCGDIGSAQRGEILELRRP